MNLTKHTYAHTFGQKSADFLFGLTLAILVSGSPGLGWVFFPCPLRPPVGSFAGYSVRFRLVS